MDYDDIAHLWKQKGLSVRSSNVLAKARIVDETMLCEKFESYEKVLRLRNCGRLTAHEIWDFVQLSIKGGSQAPPVPSYISLSNRAKNVLKRIGITNEAQLVESDFKKEDFFRLSNVGNVTYQEVWSLVEYLKNNEFSDNEREKKPTKLVPLLSSCVSEELWNALCHVPTQYLEWSIRTRKGIDASGSLSLSDILSTSPEIWLKIENFGRGSLKELQSKIAELLRDPQSIEQVLTFSSENVHELPLLHRLVPNHIWYALRVIPLQDLEWAARTRHVLEERSCRTLADIVAIPSEEWLQQANFGKRSLSEVIENISRVLEKLLHPKSSNSAGTTAFQQAQITSFIMFGHEVLQWLKKREQQVIKLYHGYDDVPQTLEEVGEAFGLTRERIRQIKEKANTRILHKPRQSWLRKTLSEILGKRIHAELENKGGFCTINELHLSIVEHANQEEQWVIRWLDEVFDEQWLLWGSEHCQVDEGICRFVSLNPQQEFILSFARMLRLYGYRPIRFDEYATLYHKTCTVADRQALQALVQSHPLLLIHEYGEQYIGHKEWGWFLPGSRNSSSRTAHLVEWFLRLTNTPTQTTAIVHGIVEKIGEFSLDAAGIIDACEKEPERFVMDINNVCQLTLWEDAAQYTPKLQEMLGDAPLHIEKIVEHLSPENPEPVVAALHVNHEIFHEPMPFEWGVKKPETRLDLAGLTCEDSMPHDDGQILRERRAGGDVTSTTSPEVVCKPPSLEIIRDVISAHFPNGFRIDSPIELLRFRRFAADNVGDEIPISDDELMKSIADCGTFFDGKVYVISNDITSRIQRNVNLVIAGSAEIIFYDSFYGRHQEWLFAGSVISEYMLKHILVKLYPKFRHKRNYCSPTPKNRAELVEIRNEIMRVWGSEVTLNFEQLSERLPYIPLDKLKHVLAQNSDFIRNSTGVYTHVGRVDVTHEECAAIADYVDAACRTDGYASLSDIPLGEIEERNHELTLTAIHYAVFGIVLADRYDRRGKIIIRQGDSLDALTIIKKHCRTLDTCTLQELLDFQRELTGESHRRIPMEAGISILVRTDKARYIADKYVHFDITGIDNALDHFVTGEYLPLKSVITFAAFPHCGQVWNVFLLESYCRRFSEKFRFEALVVNSKNAGAIVRKNCRLSYVQILADAVAKSSIQLEKTAIKEFLCHHGYIGRRSYAKVDELIEKAKDIRKRRN